MNVVGQQEKHEQWKNLIEEYEKSGLSQKIFSQQKNISLAQLGYYRGILKPKPRTEKAFTGSFAEIKINQSSQEKEIRLNLPNGFQCIFPVTIDTSHLKKLIEIMLSC